MIQPWVTPQDVKDYSDITVVQERPDAKLKVDITMAEAYVITYTKNKFDTLEYATKIPESVRLAVILLAEAYATRAVTNAKVTASRMKSGMKSESFDDYSYTVSETVGDIDVSGMNLASLLDPYVIAKASGNLIMRLRKL